MIKALSLEVPVKICDALDCGIEDVVHNPTLFITEYLGGIKGGGDISKTKKGYLIQKYVNGGAMSLYHPY